MFSVLYGAYGAKKASNLCTVSLGLNGLFAELRSSHTRHFGPWRVPKTQNLLLFTVLSHSRGSEIGPGRVEGLEKFKKSNFQLPKGPCGHDIRSTGLEKPFKISSRQLKMEKWLFMKKWNLEWKKKQSNQYF